VFRTYDHQVLNNTVFGPGTDAALLRIPGTRRAIALTTDGNPWYVALDPYSGTQAAVAEAARNIACTGARPLAVTNCLNFGNPDRPAIMWQLQESVRGLADACRELELPVVSGNVSLYNEWSGRNIPPTPVIGMVGLLEDVDTRCPAGFRETGDVVALLGQSREEVDGSEYQRWSGREAAGPPPRVDLQLERRLQRVLIAGAGQGFLRSAHDLSDGGLLVGLAEAALFGGRGVKCPSLAGDLSRLSPAARFFGESHGRVVVSLAPQHVPDLERLAEAHEIPFQVLGVVGGDEFQVGPEIRIPMQRLRQAWESPW
jgi:phosphoribosylformylglycinamidine synthase